MLKNLLTILVLAAAAASCASEPELELVSRELFEGPAREAVFFTTSLGESGVILAGGGAILVVPDGTSIEDGTMIPINGIPMEIEVTGYTAWIAAKGSGLVAIDLYDPAKPVVWNAFGIKDAVSCAKAGPRLLVGGQSSGAYLFNVANTARGESPALLSHLDLPGNVAGVAASHAYGAIASGSMALIVQVATDSLHVISTIETGSSVLRARFGGTPPVLHLLTAEGGVERYDLSEGTGPELLSPLPEKNIVDLFIGGEGGLAFLKTGMIVPFRTGEADPVDPRYSFMHGEGLTRSPGFPGDRIRYGGDRLITFGGKDGFHLYRFRNEFWRADERLPCKGFAHGVAVDGDRLYLANGREGVRIGRVLGEGKIEWTGRIETQEARGIAIAGDVMAVADGFGGVRFYSLTGTGEPRHLSTHRSKSFLSAVSLRDGKAYIAAGLMGLETVDISDPESPKLVLAEELSEVRGIDTDDGYLYVADGLNGFRIYSLGEGAPELVSTADTPGWVSDLRIEGERLYIADGQRGFMIFDVSDRTDPKRLGRADTGPIARSLSVRGGYAFIANQTRGLTVVDVSNPRSPVITDRFQTVGDARGVYADDRFVYLASGSGGLYIFEYE